MARFYYYLQTNSPWVVHRTRYITAYFQLSRIWNWKFRTTVWEIACEDAGGKMGMETKRREVKRGSSDVKWFQYCILVSATSFLILWTFRFIMFVVAWKSKQMKFVLTVRLQIEQEWTSKYTSSLLCSHSHFNKVYLCGSKTKIQPNFIRFFFYHAGYRQLLERRACVLMDTEWEKRVCYRRTRAQTA